MRRKMKKGILSGLLGALFLMPSVQAQETAAQSASVQTQAETGGEEAKKVKPLPTCLDFTEVYSRVVLGAGEASSSDREEVISLSAIVMGYASAMQDIFGAQLVGMSPQDTEWTLLDGVNKICLEYPHWTFQRAVRSVPQIRKTMDSLRDGEFTRCMAYVNQEIQSICAPVVQSKQPLQ